MQAYIEYLDKLSTKLGILETKNTQHSAHKEISI